MAEDLNKSGTNKQKKLGRSHLIALAMIAALAVLGIYQAISHSTLEGEMASQIEAVTLEREETAAALSELRAASGELTSIQAQIEATNSELADLEEQRQAAEAEFGPLAQRRDAALKKTEAAETSLSEARSQLEQTTAQLESQRSELKGINEDIAQRQANVEKTQTTLTKVTQELKTVGARLEEAREQENTLRETLSALQEEAASVSKELANAERQFQEARSAEAKLQEVLSQTAKEVAALEEQKAQLQASVSELDARHSALETDVSTAEEQRTKVQTELGNVTQLLKSRSDELLQVERRITEQQNSDKDEAITTELKNQSTPLQEPETKTESSDSVSQNETGAGGEATIQPGTYRSDNIEAQFSSDGAFRMRNDKKGAEVSGEYSVEGGIVTLSNPEGDLRKGVSFPLRCAVTLDGEAFVLKEANDGGPSCGPLADVAFGAKRQ